MQRNFHIQGNETEYKESILGSEEDYEERVHEFVNNINTEELHDLSKNAESAEETDIHFLE